MKTLSSILFFLCALNLSSQTSFDLQPGPAEGNDARIFNMDALANYGSDVDLIASQLDYGGEPGTTRSIIKFNLPFLPKEAHVADARLSLYYNHESQTPGQLGDNAAVLRRLIEPWDESTVAWNHQPFYTNENEVFLPASTDPAQDYIDINVTELVRDMYEFPSTSHGFMFMLQNEEGVGKSMKFYSSDAAIPEKRPRLVIVFSNMVATEEPSVLHVKSSPNPFQNNISLEGISGNFEAILADLNGKPILTTQGESVGNTITIDQLDKIAPGMYYITITAKDKTYLSKALKME